MSYNFPYLKDASFLKTFDEIPLKEKFVKIIVLSFDEKPIQEMQGRVVNGNFSLNGSSAMRRTANLSLILKEDEEKSKFLGMNKKVEILVGFTNNTDNYKEYPILWFPQGIYVIVSQNINNSPSGLAVSLTLHDKMALLNGECGGVLPASVTFSEIEDVDEQGEIQIRRPTIYQIILEAVNHFGGEQLGKIIISDIANKIKQVMKWTGSVPIYLYQLVLEDGSVYSHFSTNYNEVQRLQEEDGGTIQEFDPEEDIGYILTDFTFPGDLIGGIGETISSILDKIRDTLGNYEYFYDINGNFHFQEIKNYLNTSYSTFLIDEIDANNYLADYTSGKSVYSFDDAKIIQSYSNTPDFKNVKNDFLVWGKRTTATGSEIPIRYHLAIDTKPATGASYDVFFYEDPDDGITKAKIPAQFESYELLPKKGEVGIYYYTQDTGIIYKWSVDKQDYEETSYHLETVTATDYRTVLYLTGAASEPYGTDSNYYYAELKNEWPKIYDIRNQKFFDDAVAQPSDIDYFLDIIDISPTFAEFNVNNIGRRTQTIVNNDINCLFEPNNPDIVLIELGSADADEIRENCEAERQEYSQIDSELYSRLAGGGMLRSAYEEIRTELYAYTTYNEQITLSVLPIYYLEPNTRITVRDPKSGIYGDYMINTISLPLEDNGTMNLNCTKALERI